jgi:hypothetical protein
VARARQGLITMDRDHGKAHRKILASFNSPAQALREGYLHKEMAGLMVCRDGFES